MMTHTHRPLLRPAIAACVLVAAGVLGRSAARAAGELDYAVTDPALKVIRIDSDPRESFLSVRADAAGRLFVGCREALFAYEPDGHGGYRPRRLLYRFPNDSWVGDAEVRGDDLYVSTVSALYVIPGGVRRREGLHPRRLVWGMPRGHVHQCFHALAWGPEGDLYLSMGDPTPGYGDFNRPDHWAHWTFFCQPEGTRVPYTGVGGVLRCRPDGSGLRVVAGGTRNSCGLAFDRHWELFSNDNDHESIPAEYVPGRLLHVTPHADFAWPRGWMPAKTPGRADLLETMFDGMGRAVPVGQAYYDEAYFPARYRGNLLLARWGIRAVTRYPLERRGASFRAAEQVLLAGRGEARPVGVTVGRGGRVFVAVCYMAANEGSPTYRSDLVMVTRADDPSDHPFEPYEATEAPAERLWAELGDPSWGRRLRAYVEIRRRGGPLLREAVRRLSAVRADDPALHQLVWLAAASESPEAGRLLARLAGHADAAVRRQAVRALGEFWKLGGSAEDFARAVADPDPAVRHAALVALFDRPGPLPDAVRTGPARSTDTYLRQTAAYLLAEKESLADLEALCRSADPATRLAGVLAGGFRLTVPPADRPVPAGLRLDPIPLEEAYVVHYADATVDLRRFGRSGYFTVADHWKAAAHAPEQERLFALLAGRLADPDERVRLQAAHFLSLLNDPRTEPRVAAVRRESEERRLARLPLKGVAKAWVIGPFPDGVAGPERGPVDLGERYEVGGKSRAWREAEGPRFDFRKLFGPGERSAGYAYFRLDAPGRTRAQLLLGSAGAVTAWHNGREVWTHPGDRALLPAQDVVLLDLQPGGNDVLVRVRARAGEGALYLHYRAPDTVVARLPARPTTATLAERLRSPGSATAVGPEFLAVDWARAAARGDAQRGRRLFGSLGCAKCHAIAADVPVVGGPSLAEARRRFTVPYLVESVLLPSKEVSPVFRATRVETKAGQVLTGLVVSETAEKIELLLSDTTRKTVAKADVESRAVIAQSPMPQGLVKTPDELRDLLAYLLGERPEPP